MGALGAEALAMRCAGRIRAGFASGRALLAQKGQVLTFDMSIALLLMFIVMGFAAYYFTLPSAPNYTKEVLQSYMQDSATVMAKSGALAAPLDSKENPDTAKIREIMRKTPGSICLQLEAYGLGVSDGLAGYWRMEEGEGTLVFDYSGNSLVGASSGNPSHVEGRAGNALQFSGGNYVDMGTPALLNLTGTAATLSAWFSTDGGAQQAILSKYDSYSLYTTGSLEVHCQMGGTDIGSSVAFGWHHAGCVYNGSEVHLYVDGRDAGSAAKSGALSANNQSFRIGGRQTPLGDELFFTGKIDEVRVYERALSKDEVRSLYLNAGNLAYAVNKEGCEYRGGEMLALYFPFAHNANQHRNEYYSAVLRGWIRGA